MAVNDIQFLEPGAFSVIGTRRYRVGASATAINPGEPVYIQIGGQQYVLPMATSLPTTGTVINNQSTYLVGIAESTSTNTSTAAGVVDVFPAVQGVIYTIAPNVAATYGLAATPVQATYESMVGRRVTIDLTSSSYTINSTDGATNGCIVEWQDVTKANGRVAFSFRAACLYGY